MKEHPITIGIDDAAFELKSNSKKTQLIGVVCQGIRMVNVVRTEIEIDGTDATEKLIELVKQNEEHVQFILTHTITFGGFNLINLSRIYDELKKPVIAINDREVDIEAVVKALKKNFPKSYKKKLQHISDSGNLYKTEIKTAGGIHDADADDFHLLLSRTRTLNIDIGSGVFIVHTCAGYHWVLILFAIAEKHYHAWAITGCHHGLTTLHA